MQATLTPTAEPTKAVASKVAEPKAVRPKRSRKKLRIIALIVGLIIIAAAAIYFIRPLFASISGLPDPNTIQAVTTVDGQIYFGKVKPVGTGYIEIDDGYYLQPATESSTSDKPDTGKLVRLSNRLYSPSGNIVIPIRQIISFEALDPDGQIVQMMNK